MNKNELVRKIKETKTNVMLLKDDRYLKIGTFCNTFDLDDENDLEGACAFIEQYEMFKPYTEVSGRRLYYRGLKWSDLSLAQQQSIIEYIYNYDEKSFIEDNSRYAELFENNQAFLEY